jgi:ATP-dependent helicase HrpB
VGADPAPGGPPAALPVASAIPAIRDALAGAGACVLQAPPGAGKTTLVPLALLRAGAFDGRLLMLEPRRIAARTAAGRMAELLGEAVGATVGFRIRGARATGPATRIEVVTEGVLTRMIQAEPDLPGIGAVIFDEIHERALNADLGLALTLEARAALRPDLRLMAMSATLDAGPVAVLMGDAPVVTARGRAFPVDTRYLSRPAPGPGAAPREIAAAAARLTLQAVAETAGGVLVFLPGAGEIRQVATLLAGALPAGCRLRPLYGAMPLAEQRAAIRPEAGARKIVLATAIAETALTIEDIRVVVDAGRARRARFDPRSGMSRLVTERVSRAEADQRRGRAGRVAPGICYRMWMAGEEGGLAPYPPPEIAIADLAGLALELAVWGARDADALAFLTPPDPGRLAAAQTLLRALGALDRDGRATAHGRAIAALPLHPRLGHMLLRGRGGTARAMAALLAARPGAAGAATDLRDRLAPLLRPAGDGAAPGLAAIRDAARQLPEPQGAVADPDELAALAYPDRIALRRADGGARYLLSGGKGARLEPGDPLCRERLLVATDLDGDATEARIRAAIPIAETALRGVLGDRIAWQASCVWDRRARRVVARVQERLGALVLDDRPWQDCPPERIAAAALDGVRDLGLGALQRSRAALALIDRAGFLRGRGAALPDLSDAALIARAGDWLLPFLAGCRSAEDLARRDIAAPLAAWLGPATLHQIDRLAPAHFTAPSGRRVGIDYAGGRPAVAIRLQELFGLDVHPTVGPDAEPLVLTLLSPAGRPVQTTADLPGFWRSSYVDVRREMRGRYPRHPWPEAPWAALPTTRAKPRRR